MQKFKTYKAVISGIAILAWLFSAAAPTVAADEFEDDLSLKAETSILMDAHSGRILYENNAQKPLPPASLTKIMTLTVAMEALENGDVEWDDKVTISRNAWETSGSQMFLQINREVPFEELIKGIAIISANDACVAVAEHLYGSEEGFVQRMNQKARGLGLDNSSFTNASGLHDEDHYMSAEDVARLSQHLIENYPEAAQLQGESSFATDARYTTEEEDISQDNRNPLLGEYQGADGIKTGWTNQAGYSLAGTAERDGLRFISVVLNTDKDEHRKEDSMTLLNFGFNEYEKYTISSVGEAVDEAPIERGSDKTVSLHATEPLELAIPQGEEDKIDLEITLSEEISAPVEKGDLLAEITVYFEGEAVIESVLESGQDVERLGFFAHLWDQAKEFFSGLWQQAMGSITDFFNHP